MTVPRDYRDFLGDMAEACGSIIRFVDGMTLDTYLADEKTRYAVMRGYEIMGEAVRNLPEDLKTNNPDIPWTTMAAVRNRIVHGYFGIDDTKLCCRDWRPSPESTGPEGSLSRRPDLADAKCVNQSYVS